MNLRYSLPPLCLIVFPVGVHTQDDPGPETETATSESDLKTRIVGGRDAIVGQFPYQVLLLLSHQNYG